MFEQLSILSHLLSLIEDLRSFLNVLIRDKGTEAEVPADAIFPAWSLQWIFRLRPRTNLSPLEWSTTASPSYWLIITLWLAPPERGRIFNIKRSHNLSIVFCLDEALRDLEDQLGKSLGRVGDTLGSKAWERLQGKCHDSRDL